MVAFVAASGVVAWAVMHYSLASGVARRVETAPPPPAPMVIPGDQEGVSYTTVTAADVPTGHGILEISGPSDAVILVDGTDRGRGRVTLPLFAGKHDIRVRGSAGDTAKLVEVRQARMAHVRF